jgi:hypothetical protein
LWGGQVDVPYIVRDLKEVMTDTTKMSSSEKY